MLRAVVIALVAWLAITAVRVGRGFVAHALHQQRRDPWTTLRASVIARETVARVVFRLFAPLGWNDDLTPPPPEGRLVLLVGDPHLPRWSMSFLDTFLRTRGFTPWLPALPPKGEPLADQADRLASELERWLEPVPHATVDVVAFGNGGVIAAWMLAHRGPARVRRFVTLGTPWRGTRMAVFMPPVAARELAPGSPALDGLLPPRVPTVSVWCPQDPYVVPPEHAAADVAQSVAVEGVGHVALLVSSRALRAVHQALQAPLDTPA